MEKYCRNCNTLFLKYGDFKKHIKECNNNRITLGDIINGDL